MLDIIYKWREKVYPEYGIHFIHASDEWYILAERELPDEEQYDGYLQLENGVGMLRLLHDEFMEALEKEEGDDKERVMSMATGRLAYPYLLRLVQAIKDKFPNVHVNVVPIRNDFFGELITVSGLITGQDLMSQMKEQMQGERLLIPCNMLRIDEDVFLDDYTTDDVEKTLQVKLNIVKSSGQDLLDAILEK